MSVLEIPVVRWASGVISGGSVALFAFFIADGTAQLALYAMAAFVMIAEPIILRRAVQQL
ncbi:hypothetical protein KVP02_06330 [Halobacterium salinarum]|uniref:hypothetical protein n=1 Tax=Halobacterium salinarum TaxID=2242 RepID=UPI001F16E91A|nr:hypothetical protein [Halobacterium salinarum]MCF2207276.1 hypothetical protein [Halobacterium salinarum]